MYNEEVKQRFILQHTESVNNQSNCVTLFNALEKYEREWGADLCTRSTEELQPVVNNILGLRSNGRRSRLVILRMYVKWCMENGIEGACDGMMNVVDSNVDKFKQQMVNSPLHLQKYLNDVFFREEEKTFDDTIRCYFWLAFGGCPEEDIFKVRDDDIDFENMVVKVGEFDRYPIYREGLLSFKNCAYNHAFLYKHPNYSKDILRPRVGGHQLIRGIKSEADLKRTRIEVSKKTKKALDEGRTKMRLSYYRAWLSGIFYRKHQLELIGEEVDFTDVAIDFMEGKEYKLDKGRNLRGAKERRVAKEYKKDYDAWKLAYFH